MTFLDLLIQAFYPLVIVNTPGMRSFIPPKNCAIKSPVIIKQLILPKNGRVYPLLAEVGKELLQQLVLPLELGLQEVIGQPEGGLVIGGPLKMLNIIQEILIKNRIPILDVTKPGHYISVHVRPTHQSKSRIAKNLTKHLYETINI